MENIFESISERARACKELFADIDLMRPVTFETNPPLEAIEELLNGTAALYALRFEALFKAYEEAIQKNGFAHYEIEESIMQWWNLCDDLRSGSEGARHGLLDTDGLDSLLLGVRSLAVVRAARFDRVFAAAKKASGVEEQGAAPIVVSSDASSW